MMRIYFNGGVMNGRSKDVDEALDSFTFTRWYCGTYPSTAHKTTHKYIKKCDVNIGKRVAYYELEPVKLVSNCGSAPALQQMAALQQAASRPLNNIFGHRC